MSKLHLLIPTILLLCLSSCTPPDSVSELLVAFRNAQNGQLGEALFRSELCLRSNSDDVNALLLNSYCIFTTASESSQKAKALFNLDRTTRITPESFTAWYFYGWALCENQQYREALPVLEKALELLPPGSKKKGNILLLLGRCSSRNNLQEKGLRYLQPLRVHAPYNDWPEVYNSLGILALNRTDYRGAERAFKQALERERANPTVLQNLAVTYDLYLNNLAKAKATYIQCLLALGNKQHLDTRLKIQNRLRQLSARKN
ncbi:MAG: tetratricopeptide repeat protein [Lentisphaeria bacterium]